MTPRSPSVRSSWAAHPLQADDAARVLDHFVGLGPDGGVARFGARRPVQALKAYVDRMGWERQEVLGVQDVDGTLLGVAHLAPAGPGTAEMGLSVLPRAQRHGIGRALWDACMRQAQTRGWRTIVLHYQRDNPAMAGLARQSQGLAQVDAGTVMLSVPVPQALPAA